MVKISSKALFSDIVLVDIIGFSKLEINEQYEIITYISKTYRKMIKTMLENSALTPEQLLSGIIPTGDGFFCVLNPYYRGFGPILALSFNHLSELISEKFRHFKGIRIAVHCGRVQRFEDILRQENFIGDGLNECARYISAQSHNISTVIISEHSYQALDYFLKCHHDFHVLLLEREFKFSAPFQFFDKHGNEYKAYLIWMRHGGIINPPNLQKRAHSGDQRSNFAF